MLIDQCQDLCVLTDQTIKREEALLKISFASVVLPVDFDHGITDSISFVS